MSKIKITDTSLRDGHQSLWATRMTTKDMLPILEDLDQVGYHSLEVWGGATFDVCIRYLNEDPWTRLKLIRQHVKNTKLQMLVRGQSLVGYTHYPDDVAERFIEKAAENGIEIFRVFDALNDLRNLETVMKTIKKTGLHAQACVVYTISPVHSLNHFLDTALKLQDMGADSICIKDMAGLLAPYASYDLVKSLKENLRVPVQLHTHYIGGLAIATLLKAAEAGVDVIDTASVPMAFGSSQPPVETIVRALQESDWDTGLDLHKLFDVANYFEKMRLSRGFERGVTSISDMQVFEHQIPGGMISNLYSQLEEQKASDRIGEVLDEIPKVRADLGFPPLVTPTSQIIVIQAVLNVLMEDRYKLCPAEVKDYVKGLYGRPPVAITDEIKKKIIGDEAIITVRPADLLEPILDKCRNETRNFAKNDEDVLTYALFPQVALKFFEARELKTNLTNEDSTHPADKKGTDVAVSGKKAINEKKAVSIVEGDEEMRIEEIEQIIKALDNSSIEQLDLQKNNCRLYLSKSNTVVPERPREYSNVVVTAEEKPPVVEEQLDLTEIIAPMVGTFYAAPSPEAESFVKVGDVVEQGQTLCILEAMKLMNEIKAEARGTIVKIMVENNEAVEYGQVLFLIQQD